MALRLGVDVGGTFTDVVAVDAGRVAIAKVPSTPADQSDGVLAGWDALGLDAATVAVFAHGTTVATNALLERRGGATALVTTEGFRDVLEIGRQDRPSLYDLTRARPSPLVPRELRFVVRERMGPDGRRRAAGPGQPGGRGRRGGAPRRSTPSPCACCSASCTPSTSGRSVRRCVSGCRTCAVSLSHEVLPEVREYERISTTVADAYLRPRMAAYLEHLARRAAGAGLPAPLVMQSSGGVLDVGRRGPAPRQVRAVRARRGRGRRLARRRACPGSATC